MYARSYALTRSHDDRGVASIVKRGVLNSAKPLNSTDGIHRLGKELASIDHTHLAA